MYCIFYVLRMVTARGIWTVSTHRGKNKKKEIDLNSLETLCITKYHTFFFFFALFSLSVPQYLLLCLNYT